jgi:3-dehydroquinate dehydratase/shikimate dehydrogenase
MDPLTAKIGACNTLRTGADGNLYGFNTDVAGVVRPLERRLRLKGARVLVLGAGGAARAAVFGLVEQGAEVFITNRTHETAVSLARKAKAKALKRDLLAKNQFDVVINTTPCGMAGVLPALPIGEKELNARLVFDMVYTPIETPLLKMARARGMAVISGLEMFVQQGARQFEIFTGKPAPEEEMLRVVIHSLRQQAEAAAHSEPEHESKPAAAKADSHPAPAKAAAKPAPAKPAAKVAAKVAVKPAARPVAKVVKPAAKAPAKKATAKKSR